MYSGTDGTVCGQSSSWSHPRQSNYQNINGISKDTTPCDGMISEQGIQSSSTTSSALTSSLMPSTCSNPNTTKQTFVTSGVKTYQLSIHNIISIWNILNFSFVISTLFILYDIVYFMWYYVFYLCIQYYYNESLLFLNRCAWYDMNFGGFVGITDEQFNIILQTPGLANALKGIYVTYSIVKNIHVNVKFKWHLKK